MENHSVKNNITVLYIEDNPNDIILVKRFIGQMTKDQDETETFQFESVDRVSKGIERMAKGGVDLVLTDLNLPDAHELEAVKQLRSHFPMIPIIALTSAYTKSLGLQAVREGAQDYLVKDELNARMISHSVRYAIERKKVEMMKEEFMSTVSHELITPLTIIKGGLDNINLGFVGPVTPKQKEILFSVSKSIDRLARIIADILSLSRLESKHVELKCQATNLKSLIREVISVFDHEAKEKHILLEEDIPSSVEVFVDSNKLVQVLNNLISNALRYAKTKIMITCQPIDQMMSVRVIDDGPGLSQEDQAKLFNKFVQINRPEGGEGYKGTGLGLAICKEIIDLQKGKIWVESQLGHGAQFCFTVPLPKGK